MKPKVPRLINPRDAMVWHSVIGLLFFRPGLGNLARNAVKAMFQIRADETAIAFASSAIPFSGVLTSGITRTMFHLKFAALKSFHAARQHRSSRLDLTPHPPS